MTNESRTKNPPMKYYVLQIIGDVEPVLHGSFATAEERDTEARRLRAADGEKENGLYPIESASRVIVASYFGGDFPD